MTNKEYNFFRKILPQYYEHMIENKNTVITRIYGLHKILYHKNTRRQKIRFFIMANAFNTKMEINRRFDLKGSKYKRNTAPDADHTIARKDLDFINEKRRINLGPERKDALID